MKNRLVGGALAALALACALNVQAADNYQVKDGSGASITLKAKEVAGVKAVTHTVANSDGTTLINPATSDKQPSLGTAGTPSSNVLTVQGITSMTALKVDGSAVTQPVSAASLPLPTGAATSANQTTLNGYVDGIEGLLGTGNSSLLTLAGAVSGGNVQVVCTSGCSGGGGGSGYSVLNASTYANTSSYSNVPSGGLVGTSAPTYTNGQASPLSLTTAGALRIDGSAVTQPVSGTFWQTTQPVSAASLPLPSGAATSANQTTIAGYVDGLEALVGSTNTALGTLNTTAGAPSVAQDTAGAVKIIQAAASAAINLSTATTTEIVALSSGKKIYVTAIDVMAGGTANVTFKYGTGTNCGTGTASLSGAYPLTAQAGLTKGSGLGPVLVVPAGNALCVTSSAAVTVAGSVAYAQF